MCVLPVIVKKKFVSSFFFEKSIPKLNGRKEVTDEGEEDITSVYSHFTLKSIILPVLSCIRFSASF